MSHLNVSHNNLYHFCAVTMEMGDPGDVLPVVTNNGNIPSMNEHLEQVGMDKMFKANIDLYTARVSQGYNFFN